MAKEVNVLALVKGDEQYLFLFDDSNRVETLRLLGRYAADPELSFSWYDAAVLSQKIRATLSASVSPSSATPANASQSNGSAKSTADAKPIRFQFPSFKEERLPE